MLMINKPVKLAKAAYKLAKKKVDWKKVGREYQKAYRRTQQASDLLTKGGLVASTLGTATANAPLLAGGQLAMGVGVLGGAANEAIHAGVGAGHYLYNKLQDRKLQFK